MERVVEEALLRESRRRCDGGNKTLAKNTPELAEERRNVIRTARYAASVQFMSGLETIKLGGTAEAIFRPIRTNDSLFLFRRNF